MITESDIQHTPIPWVAGGWSSAGTPIIAKDPRKTHARTIAIVPCEFVSASQTNLPTANDQADYELYTTKANTALIVRAVNAYEALLSAVEKAEYCLDFINAEIVTYEDQHRALNALRAEIAIAKGKARRHEKVQ